MHLWRFPLLQASTAALPTISGRMRNCIYEQGKGTYYRRPWNLEFSFLLVDCILESFTCCELHCVRSGDFDLFPGTRIPAGAFRTLAGGECTETDQLYCIAIGYRLDDVVDNRFERALCNRF